MAEGNVIVLEGVRFRWGRRKVLRGAALQVPRGSVTALLGRNGEGKTTLVRCILGQVRPAEGRVEVLGCDPWQARKRLMQRVGVVPETPDAPPSWTVGRVIAFCGALSDRFDRDAALDRLGKAGIGSRVRVGELSRGQRAHLQLALALAGEPDLLVLDDPALGLDPVARGQLYREIVEELALRGTTVFLTTHDLDGVERLADRVAILHGGRIVLDGALEEIRTRGTGTGPGPAPLEAIFTGVTMGGV